MEQVKKQSAVNLVVIRSSIVHCLGTGESKTWGKPRSYRVRSLDEADVRWTNAGDHWRELDHGHVENPSTVIIENLLKDSAGTVEVSCDPHVPPFCLLRPGRDVAIPEPRQLFVRCVGGQAKVRIISIPS